MPLIITLASIAVLFVLFALVKSRIKKIAKYDLCAICAAVSITWIATIIIALLGYKIDKVLLAVLMGQSIAGMMYLLEEKFKTKRSYLIKLGTIIGGTIIAYYVIQNI